MTTISKKSKSFKLDKELFSPTEQIILQILGKRTMTTSELADEYEESGLWSEPFPLYMNNTISGIIRRINKKCEYHKLPWFINGVGSGRLGKSLWRDKR